MDYKKLFREFLKYLVGALAGALGVSVTGCTCIPFFNF